MAVSYGTQPFFGVDAFKFTNAEGTSKFGRYRILPESGAAYVSDEEAAKRPPNALADKLTGIAGKRTVKFQLLVQLAAADDSITDATKVWPDSRATVELGENRGGQGFGYEAGRERVAVPADQSDEWH